MKENHFSFHYLSFESEKDLPADDFLLLTAARRAATVAYAPYSGFLVGASGLLANGEIITGSNQENASYPAGLCAERSLLSSAAQQFPNIAMLTMAVTYLNTKGKSDAPATPCGFCRQVMAEFELRVNHTIRLVLCGSSGPAYIIPQSSFLLPLSFTSINLY